VSYVEAGYLPIKRRGGYVLGVDPLPLVRPIPWLSEFRQGRIEDLELHGFSQAAFVTTFDHVENIDAALTRLREAGVAQIFLWETLYRRRSRGDLDHPHHYTYGELTELLSRHGFRVVRVKKVDELRDTEGCFMEARTMQAKP
jgi:hypothetical protein